ncbi:MAG: hypothetical protein E7051_06100 [Lentisphaerae bacterium]|nr:hypothetical protein [Lentisphaerota bacterium]
MILDGIWEFAWCKDNASVPCFDTFAAVPGCFDTPGMFYPEQGTAYYRRKVTAGGSLRLKIASFGLHAQVFWDGEKIAESFLAWSPLTAEFSTSDGVHELIIKVDNFIAGHPLFREDYDFYNFGGIYDHVTLENISADSIRKLAVFTLDHETGEIELQIESAAEKLDISFDGKFFRSVDNTPSLRLKVPDFKLWSIDTPDLHTVTVNEKTVTFGIRTINWDSDVLKINGKVVKLIGVNRHESHPEFGAATPEALIASDLCQIKKAGFNFVRGSHYPQREFFFEMCDRLGLLVWEEPLSWGNCESDLQDPVFMDTLEAQLRDCIANSINHPSLIIHGFLNECASDTDAGYAAVKRLTDVCHQLDPGRPATFATNRPLTDKCFELVDIIAMNIYPAWYSGEYPCDIPGELEKYTADLPEKPLVISEIGAAAIYGDHSGTPWSEEYQSEYVNTVLESVAADPRFSGVILWLFCNANTYIDPVRARFRPRGFNNKGLLDEYRRPKLAWKNLKIGREF